MKRQRLHALCLEAIDRLERELGFAPSRTPTYANVDAVLREMTMQPGAVFPFTPPTPTAHENDVCAHGHTKAPRRFQARGLVDSYEVVALRH